LQVLVVGEVLLAPPLPSVAAVSVALALFYLVALSVLALALIAFALYLPALSSLVALAHTRCYVQDRDDFGLMMIGVAVGWGVVAVEPIVGAAEVALVVAAELLVVAAEVVQVVVVGLLALDKESIDTDFQCCWQ
jgi:hypothetical protein